MEDKIPFFKKLLKEKILILDGAMGTMIQGYEFTEKDFRGTRFTSHPCDLKGNNDSKLLPWEVTTPLIRTILDGAVSKEDKLSITKLAEKP